MNDSTPFGGFPRETPSQTQPPMPPFGGDDMPSFDTGGGWGDRGSGWFRENASSVVLPIIALLVLGGGVYFYTRGRAAPERPIVEFEDTTAQISPSPETTDTITATASPTPSPTSRIRLSPEGQAILGGPEETPVGPMVRLEDNAYKVKAVSGDGITHLARKAAREYLAKTNPGYTVTREHKVYIEDFLKDDEVAKRAVSAGLTLGEEVSFSEEMLKQAVERARGLSDKDLKNLEQYSARVTNL